MKFRKKPVVIEAVRWTGTNLPEVKAFCPTVRIDSHRGQSSLHLTIPTLEGDHLADLDDWIIRGVKGEFYPDIFAMTYEPVDLFDPDTATKTTAQAFAERMANLQAEALAKQGDAAVPKEAYPAPPPPAGVSGFIRLRDGSQYRATTTLVAKKYITSVAVHVYDEDKGNYCVVVKTTAMAYYYGPRVFDTEEDALAFAQECVTP